MAHVPEVREVFLFLSVRDNLCVGAFCRSDNSVEADLETVYGYFSVLEEKRRKIIASGRLKERDTWL